MGQQSSGFCAQQTEPVSRYEIEGEETGEGCEANPQNALRYVPATTRRSAATAGLDAYAASATTKSATENATTEERPKGSPETREAGFTEGRAAPHYADATTQTPG